jgi:iron complex outermembrane receptor protein
MRVDSFATLAALLLASSSLGVAGAWAQTASLAGNEAGVTVLDTIIITARKRSEDAQTVPISTNIIEGERLKEISPVSSNADLARVTPNFSFVELGGIYANVGIIRGVGSLFPISSDDTSVSYNVDEVPLSAFGMAPSTLDLQRVEVMRGPQGTLYGRNAQAGAVNFVPNRPDFVPEYQLRGEVGTNGWHLGEFIANTPLIQDVLAGRLAVQYSSRDGDVSNVVIGGKDGDVQIGSARGALLYTPDEDTSALLTFNYSQYHDSIPTFILKDADCYPCSGVNPRFKVDNETYGLNLRFEHSFEGFKLTSISAVQHTPKMDSEYDLADSLVYGAMGLSPSNVDEPGADLSTSKAEETTYFQEVRLSSPEDSLVTWTAGLNFSRSELTVDGEGKNISPSFAVYSGQRYTGLTSNSYAVFGEATVPLVGALNGLIGARLTHDDKDVSYRYIGAGVPRTVASHAQDASFSDTYFTGRAGLSYNWSEDFMTYATVGRGAVGGGYQYFPRSAPYGGDQSAFPTSTSMTYEAGFKSSLWDGRATLNASIFFNDVSKGHVVDRVPGTYIFGVAALDYES